MDLDPAVLLPAVLFTVVAVSLASSLLRRKPDRTASCSAGTNKPKVGHGDDVAPSRPPGEPLLSAGPEPAEKKRDSPELKVKVAPEPAPEPVTVPEPVKLPEPVIKQAPSQVPFPEPLEVSVPVTEPAVEPEPAKEPELVKQNLGKLSPELTAAQKRVLETLKVVESVPEPEPVTVTKTLVDSSVVPEPESSASPEPVKVSDPEPKPEVVQQPETEPEFEKVDESGPEPAAENVSEPKGLVPEEPEPEDNSLNDVDAAAAQIESSKLEALMEEQRVELTSDLTCL